MPGKSDINITVSTVDLDLMVKTGPDGLKAFSKRKAPPAQGIPSPYEYISGFAKGAGAEFHKPGYYLIGSNFDGSNGYGMPGPREVADLANIAAGFRVVKMLLHADTQIVVATDGTSTRVYRLESGAWQTKVDQLDGAAQNQSLTGIATDAVSFKGVLAIALAAASGLGQTANSYVFTTATTATGQTWDFTTSTKTGNADTATFFLVQMNGLIASRVFYVRNPNECYFTEDLSNTDATGSTASTIGDTQTAQNWFTSLSEDDQGVVLIGMRHALFSLASDGTVQKLSQDFPDPVTDAGGQSDRGNFEAYAIVDGRHYYGLGYEVGEYYHGQWNLYMAPKWQCPTVPRAHLPVNAMAEVNGWLYLAIGSKNTSTLKGVVHAAFGGASLANIFTTTSDLWKGRYVEDPLTGQTRWVWHGVILECTDPLRYMWYDENTNYLYLSSGDSELIDAQMRRALIMPDNPLFHLSSSNVVLATGTWQCELGLIDYNNPALVKEARRIFCHTHGLASTTPSLEVEYKKESTYNTDAFASAFVTYTSNATAETGTAFTVGETFRTLGLRFRGVGDATNNLYAILRDAVLLAEDVPDEFDLIDIVCSVVNAPQRPTGAKQQISARQISDNLNTWKGANLLALLTLRTPGAATDETWRVRLEDYKLKGMGKAMELTLRLREAYS